MSPYLGIADYLGILDAPVNNVMMKTTMKENGYFNALFGY